MIDLHCRCSAVHLRYHGEALRHVVCHCADCRASRDWLAAQGGPDGMHPSGGDGTVLVWSDGIEVVRGREHLGTYSIARRIRTPRVRATCCHTPLASTFTLSARISALKTVAAVDPTALPPLDGHIFAPGPRGDGLPAPRGLGLPFLATLLRAVGPWSGHRGVRWIGWSPQETMWIGDTG